MVNVIADQVALFVSAAPKTRYSGGCKLLRVGRPFS
jgi:hypothetical protein